MFCWFIFVLETDRLVQYLGMGHLKIALILGLALRLFPLMYADWLRIIEVQRTRGQGTCKKKKKKGKNKTITAQFKNFFCYLVWKELFNWLNLCK